MNLLEFTQVDIKPEDDSKVYRYISKILGNELTETSKPCHKPKLIKYFSDLQYILGIDNDKIKEFVSGIVVPYPHIFKIYKDKFTVLLLIATIYYTRKGKFDIAKSFFTFLNLKFYSSRIHKHFPKFCNGDLWILTLDKLSPKHLFKTKKGIPNTILYIAEFDYNKNKDKLKSEKLQDKILGDIVYGLRTKIAQSVKSFAQLYHSMYEAGLSKTSSGEDQIGGAKLIADKISMTMCTFGQIDKGALSKAIIQSRLRKDLSISIVSQFSTSEYKDKIRFIILLISRVGDFKDICIETNRLKLIRRINSNYKISGQYSIKAEIKNLLYSLESGYQLKNIYESQLINFFSNYITLFIGSRIC
jgi:hypothetical protein